jgi:hypothetical protein
MATGVPLDQILAWTTGLRTESVNVYFGTNPTPGIGEFQGNQTESTFDPGTLDEGLNYYWRIDPVNDGGTTTGTVWHFHAFKPVVPVIESGGDVIQTLVEAGGIVIQALAEAGGDVVQILAEAGGDVTQVLTVDGGDVIQTLTEDGGDVTIGDDR